MFQRISYGPIAIAIVALLALVVALPDNVKGWAPAFFSPSPHLGLDLAGGTQLDFRISEEDIIKREADLEKEIETLKAQGADAALIAEKRVELDSVKTQHENLVEAIRAVLERRINALGVSESTITPSYYGSEKHLLVDCPGVVDIQRCIQTVGKTIQLEFKEEFTEANDDYRQKVRANANTAFTEIKDGRKSLQTVGQDMSDELGVAYFDVRPYFQNELPEALKALWTRSPSAPAIMTEGTIQTVRQNEEGKQELVDVSGIYIAQTLEAPKPAMRTLTNPPDALKVLQERASGSVLTTPRSIRLDALDQALQDQLSKQQLGSVEAFSSGAKNAVIYLSSKVEGKKTLDVSHILVSYKGAQRADAVVMRSKDEARERAEALKQRLDNGEDFAALASVESDGPSKAQAGRLGPTGQGVLDPAFEAAALKLKKGQVSSIVETLFGFHIIKANENVIDTGTTVSYDMLELTGSSARSQAEQFVADIQAGNVQRSENQVTLRVLFLSLDPTGWKDTELNGQHFRSATVSVDPVTNIPVVQIQFDSRGAELFRELTRRNVNKRLAIFVGGELVSAPVVQGEISGGSAVITGSQNFDEANRLAQDLNTGAIPAPIYLAGQHTIQATLGANALSDSLLAGFVGFIILCAAMIAIYRLLGVIASATLLLYFVLLMAFMKLPLFLVTNEYIVITLAGIAGVILSIGMAVDANILIFERMKEEIKKGKTLRSAAATGFKRAWPSIRDGNMTTLISAAILIVIGTSIVRGFAITLALGIFIALFCSLVVSKWLLDRVLESPLAEHEEYFVRKKHRAEQ